MQTENLAAIGARAENRENKNWREVSKNNPCIGCGKADWCRCACDGGIYLCSRVSKGSVAKRIARNGAEFYVHLGRPKTAVTPLAESGGRYCARANARALDAVYKDLLTRCPLTDEHRLDLIRRGLSEAEILTRRYGSLPEIKARPEIADHLVREHGEDVIECTPGLFRLPGGSHWGIAGASGLMIPVRNLEEETTAIKLRSYGGDNRYSYLSSTGRGGPGPGSPVHRPIYGGNIGDFVRVTEGELKADVATALTGILHISIPGVTAWRSAIPILKSLDAKNVSLAFDNDLWEKPQVSRALLDFSIALKGEGFKVGRAEW